MKRINWVEFCKIADKLDTKLSDALLESVHKISSIDPKILEVSCRFL